MRLVFMRWAVVIIAFTALCIAAGWDFGFEKGKQTACSVIAVSK